MSKVVKVTQKQIREMVNKVLREGKKPPKKEKDSKYETWCKENGWENGVGEGCADDALDSKESSIRSWGLGFLMGSKGKSLNEQRDGDEETEDTGYNRLVDYLQPLVNEGIIDSDVRDDILDLAVAYADGPDVEYVDYDGEPLVNPSFDDGDETFTKADERRYDDRVNYGTDDESMYDDRNYQYGNHPDDDYED